MSKAPSSARGAWASRSTFILASVSSAVGLGNAWRFPALCARHGGGTFLLIYLLAILVMGLPLLMMEIAIGRHMRGGAVTSLGGLNKKFEPIGWAATSNAFFIATYYAVVFAWVILMTVCCYQFAPLTGTPAAAGQIWPDLTNSAVKTFAPSFPTIACLLVAWGLIYFCIRNGTDSVNKVAKYTVVLPVICLVIMAAKGVTMPGAGAGLKQLFLPDMSKFADPKLWVDAFGQVFYSLSIMMAIMFAYGSFLDRKSNIAVDATIIALSDLFISILASVVMFSTMYGTGLSDQVSELGMGATFTVYPTAIVSLTDNGIVNTLFGFVFFFCLCTLALGSAFSIIEGVSTSFSDKFGISKKKATAVLCVIAGVISLVFTSNWGVSWLDVTDNWCNSFNLILIGVLETLAIGWGFKTVRILKEINRNTASFRMPSWWFNASVKVISPLLLCLFFIWNLVDLFQKGGIYGPDALSDLIFGWGMMAVVFASGFIVRWILNRKAKNGFEEPSPSWDSMDNT